MKNTLNTKMLIYHDFYGQKKRSTNYIMTRI